MTNQASPRMFAAADGLATRSSDAILLVARCSYWLALFDERVGQNSKHARFCWLSHEPACVRIPASGHGPPWRPKSYSGITLILGIATRYASLFAFVYVIITIALAHRYWEYPAAQYDRSIQ